MFIARHLQHKLTPFEGADVTSRVNAMARSALRTGRRWLIYTSYKHPTPNGVQDNSSNLMGLLSCRNCFLSGPVLLEQVDRTIRELEEMRMRAISVS